MRPAFCALAALLLLPVAAAPASAHDHDTVHIGDVHCCDRPVRWGPRYDDGRDIHFAITNEDRKVTLLLTDDAVAFQLSDRVMRKVDRELHRARHEDDDDGPIGDAVKTVVLGMVREMLDHSAQCPLRELGDVRYEGGRLVFVDRDGERVFERFTMDDQDLLATFEPQDAREFVREFQRWKARR